MDVGLVPERETHNDDCDNEELVDVGLVPERETHNDDCGHEDLLDDDTNDVVSSLSVIPNEIVSYIIHLVLLSDLTMLGTINRVSETFRECATVAMTNRWPRLHQSESVADTLIASEH